MVYPQAISKMRYALFLAGSIAAAAGAGRDPAEVLQCVTAKVRARDASLPNYTCVQTVTRDYYKPRASTLPRSCPVLAELRRHPTPDMVLERILTDRLRLDVTMTERGEIYSWVGASKFEDASIDQVVREGPIGTGEFGGFLTVVFGRDVKTFRFEREVLVVGHRLMEYSFQVGKAESSYKVKADNSWIVTAYSGTFRADPETCEVVRLEVQSAELPPATGSCVSLTAMDFGPVRIDDTEFLLPKQAQERFVTVTGEEAENTTTFANCREYRGESTVTFFPEPAPAGGKSRQGAPATPIQAPANEPFTFELTTSIATDTAAAGDAFEGRLVNALRDQKGKTLAPAHAVVEGRLLRVQIVRRLPPRAILVLKLRTVEIKGAKVPLAAIRDWSAMRTERGGKLPILLPFPWEENSGVFQLEGDHASMQAGFRSKWLTQ